MDIRFDGKIAIVTGGASGIGAAIANELSASGAAVAILDVNADGVRAAVKAIKTDGGIALGCPADVTDAEATAAAVGAATTELGRLDIIVNCAGKAGTRAFLDASPEETRQLVEVNLLSTVNVCQAALPHLIERGGGRVVNISSDAGRVGAAGDAIYAAAKGGVISLTKSLALEFARHGITVNCVSPGPTDTPMLRQFSAGAEGVVERLIKTTPLRRLGQPEDIAAAVLFLASDRASHITGQVLSVSGGLTMSD